MRLFTKVVNRSVGQIIRRISTEESESCNDVSFDKVLKIQRDMRHEMRDIANTVVENRTAQINNDLNALRTESNGMKNDITSIKSDISSMKIKLTGIESDISGIKIELVNVKSDIKEINRNIHDLYKQNSTSTRLLLSGFFGVTTAAVGINQYMEIKREEIRFKHNA